MHKKSSEIKNLLLSSALLAMSMFLFNHASVSASTFDSDIVPGSDATYNLGSSSYHWQDLNLSRNLLVAGTGSFTTNVGIGTASPNAKLSIAPGSTNLQSINFFDSNYGIGMDSSDLVFWGNASQGISFKDNSNSGYGGNSLLRIKGSGLIGVASTSPWGLLSVNANAIGSAP